MKAETEVWQLMTHDGVYQADLPTLKQWVAEGIVLPTDKVRKGAFNWIDAGLAPSLRAVFAGEEVPEPSQETAPASAKETQHAHAALGEAHAAATGAHAPDAAPNAASNAAPNAPRDLGLSAGVGAPHFAEDNSGGFIEAVSTRDFPGVLPGVEHEANTERPAAPRITCQNHPADAAALICRTCRSTFCRACPNRMGTSSVLLCPACGNFCDPLEDINVRLALLERAASGFGIGDFKEALAYPLKHFGSLISGALLYSFLLLGGLWGHLLAPALVFGCISLVIHRVAYGDMKRDFLPDFSEFSIWDDMIVPYFLGWGVTLVTLGPIILMLAVLVFGLFGGVGKTAAPAAPPQSQMLTSEDMKVLQNGGTAEQEAELKRKVDAMTPTGQMAQQVEAAKKKQQDDSTLAIVRTLLAHPGLYFLLGLLALAWAVFYYPMALLVAGWTESFKSIINPLVGIDTMRHMGVNYFKAFAMYLAVQLASVVVGAVIAIVTSPFDMPFVGNIPGRFLGGFVTFYTSLVVACVLGLSLFKSSDRLGIELD